MMILEKYTQPPGCLMLVLFGKQYVQVVISVIRGFSEAWNTVAMMKESFTLISVADYESNYNVFTVKYVFYTCCWKEHDG